MTEPSDRALGISEEILTVMKEIRFNLALVAGELHQFNKQREDERIEMTEMATAAEAGLEQ